MAEQKTKAVTDGGQAEVQRKFDEAQEQGYIGSTPDKTPNEAYTVAGVNSGAKTPETDKPQTEDKA